MASAAIRHLRKNDRRFAEWQASPAIAAAATETFAEMAAASIGSGTLFVADRRDSQKA
jgi:hypothetical protein